MIREWTKARKTHSSLDKTEEKCKIENIKYKKGEFALFSMDEFDVINIQPELRLIVNALAKAVGPDIREYLTGNNMDTNNAIMLLRGDFINTNLRDMVVGAIEDLELKHFKRFVWTGSLLIDHKHKITITVSARQTLSRIKGVKDRQNPHYLQSMCHILNGDLNASCKQMTLADIAGTEFNPPFSDETYEEDFDSIVDAAFGQGDGYRHCVVAYEAERLEIKSLSLLLLDKDLDVVHDISLMDLLQPDFGTLTAPVAEIEERPVKQDAHSLVKIKAGLKSKNASEPERKVEIPTKQEEGTKQA